MAFEKEEVQILTRLGLTSCQARAYLALARSGISTAQNLSKTSQVTRQDIYRIIPTLEEHGLVEKIIDSPIKLKALPMNEAIHILLERRTQETFELKIKAKEIIKSKKAYIQSDSSEDTPKFVVIPSNDVIIKRLRNAIERTKKRIDLSTSCKRFQFACYSLSGDLEKAWDRGVKGRAIIEETNENNVKLLKATWRRPAAEIKFVFPAPKTVMAIYDKKEVFIFTKPSAALKESPALWSDAPSLVGMAADYFEIMWKKARALKQEEK